MISRILLLLLFSLVLSASVDAQIRGEFHPVKDAETFQMALAVEADKTNSIIVLFPEDALSSTDKFKEAILFVVPKILGCETFKGCKAVINGVGHTAEDQSFLVMNTTGKFRVLVFMLGNSDKTKVIGVVLQASTLPVVDN